MAAAENAQSKRISKVLIADGVCSIMLVDCSPYLEFCLRETKFLIQGRIQEFLKGGDVHY